MIIYFFTRTHCGWRGSIAYFTSRWKIGTVLASESRQAVTSIVSDEVAARATILTRIGDAGIDHQLTIMTLWHKWKK